MSIVIPVYNGSDYLAEAIDSALGQTYPNIEVVVVNDGSSDGGATAAVAARYGDRIRYVEKVNGGVASALNVGIRTMSGELFSWLSHDDMYYPTKVEEQVDKYVHVGSPCLIFGDFEHVSETGEHLRNIEMAGRGFDQRPLDGLFRGAVNGCTFLIPRDVLLDLNGFREGMPTTQDYELWFRITQRLPFVHLPRVLVRQRLHAAQGSRVASHLDEASRLMIYMIDRTTPEVMTRYDGSVERFLIRTARELAISPYSGGAAYAAFRVRQALLRLAHQIVLVLQEDALTETLAAIASHETQFLARQWLLVTPDAPPRSFPPHIKVVHRSTAQTPDTVIGIAELADQDLVLVACSLPRDEILLPGFEAFLFQNEPILEIPVQAAEAATPGWLLRRSRSQEAMSGSAAHATVAHACPADGAAAPPDAPAACSNLRDKSLRWLRKPGYIRLLQGCFAISRMPRLHRPGMRLLRFALRKAGLGKVVDASWYRETYCLHNASGLDTWVDYFTRGWREGREPSGWFDGGFYVQQTSDWDGSYAPLRHYLLKGAVMGLLPHPSFQVGTPQAPAYIAPPVKRPSNALPVPTGQGEALSAATLTAGFQNDRPTVLLCLHSWGGGTLTHARELANALRKHANVLFLFGGPDRPLVLSAKASLPPEGSAFDPQSGIPQLAELLETIGIDHVDVHHASGFETELETLLARLAIPYDVTLVDYHLLAEQPHLAGRDGRFVGDGPEIAGLLRSEPLLIYRNAARRIAISRDMARRVRALAPDFDVICAANWLKPPIEGREVLMPRIWDDETLRVLIFGPISAHKGWYVLSDAADKVTERGLPIEFHVLGASDDGNRLPLKAGLIDHGWFTSETLAARIGSIAPHVVWYPAQVPETWCYALNDGMTASLPIVANAIGALTERCHGRPATWLLPVESDAGRAVDLFNELRTRAFDVPTAWPPIDGLPAAEPFYFEAYLAPARKRHGERRKASH